jgi:hypothetical protein
MAGAKQEVATIHFTVDVIKKRFEEFVQDGRTIHLYTGVHWKSVSICGIHVNNLLAAEELGAPKKEIRNRSL